MAGTYQQAALGEPNATAGPKWLAQFKGMNEVLNSENALTTEGLAKGNLGRLYAPSIISTEQSRESSSYGKLATPDEVTGVVLPANGLLFIAFSAHVKSSVSENGQAAFFLGANQLKKSTSTKQVQEASTVGTEFTQFGSSDSGMAQYGESNTADVTTGQIIGSGTLGGYTLVFAEAGTYTVSVQFKAITGKVTAKERKLWVGVMGV